MVCLHRKYALFRGMRKIKVRYMLTTASKVMSGIMAAFFIPMMHCPFSSMRVMRLYFVVSHPAPPVQLARQVFETYERKFRVTTTMYILIMPKELNRYKRDRIRGLVVPRMMYYHTSQ